MTGRPNLEPHCLHWGAVGHPTGDRWNLLSGVKNRGSLMSNPKRSLPVILSGAAVDLGQGSSLLLGNNRFEAKKVTMQTLADVLARFVDRPVVNSTGLEGRYDVTFEVPADDFRAMMIRSALASGA